jgi:hypothetical protein
MPELRKDINILVNLGGALTHWNGVEETGGGLALYDNTPVGGPPGADVDADVRERMGYTVRTRIPGVDEAARETYAARFANGTTFDAVSNPSTSGQMRITGKPAAIGRRFTVTNALQSTSATGGGATEGQNTEMTITLIETGASPS